MVEKNVKTMISKMGKNTHKKSTTYIRAKHLYWNVLSLITFTQESCDFFKPFILLVLLLWIGTFHETVSSTPF